MSYLFNSGYILRNSYAVKFTEIWILFELGPEKRIC